AFVWLRTSVPGNVLLGITLGIAGTAVLGMDGNLGEGLGWGEGFTLVASLLFAVQILLLDHLGRTVRSVYVTVGLFALSGVAALLLAWGCAALGPGTAAWLAWTASMVQDPYVLRDVLLMTVLSTVVAFLWMNQYQPGVSASRAALIYLLEP